MDWQKEAERVRQAMLEHKRKLETDPEYRKQSEEFSKKLEEAIPILKYRHAEE